MDEVILEIMENRETVVVAVKCDIRITSSLVLLLPALRCSYLRRCRCSCRLPPFLHPLSDSIIPYSMKSTNYIADLMYSTFKNVSI